jgi:hypothetical protein
MAIQLPSKQLSHSVYNVVLMSAQANVIGAREEVARAGEHIYEQYLRSLLEPDHTGRLVLIHLPSRDYFLSDSLVEGSDRLHEKYPNASRGEIYARRVGQEAVIWARTPRVTGEPL